MRTIAIENADPGDAKNTPFVYFFGGIAVFPPPTLPGSIAVLVSGSVGVQEMREKAKSLATWVNIGGQRTAPPTNYWYHYLEHFLRSGVEQFSTPETQSFIPRLFELCLQTPPEAAWASLRDFAIANIDAISGWTTSVTKRLADQDAIYKGDDGNYYRDAENGTTIQVIGAKTAPETRLDFITHELLMTFGHLRQFLNVFAACGISCEFDHVPEQFPVSMKATMAEPAHHIGTGFGWHLMQNDRTRSIAWRPPSVFCDPDWLAADLLARVTDTLTRDFRKGVFERQKDLPDELDKDCKYQLDYVVDSAVSIGTGEQVYIHFEGRTFRWINGTPETKPTISVGVKNLRSHRDEDESLNRLLSIIVWEHRHSMAKGFGVGGARSVRPKVWAARSHFGLRVEPQYLFGRAKAPKPERWLALALYKEAINSQSTFYKFLTLWKIIEHAIKKPAPRMKWINESVQKLVLHRERIAAIAAINPDFANYLNDSCRNAIAHVRRAPIVNPDDPDDNLRITQDVRIVEDLARLAVNEFLPE